MKRRYKIFSTLILFLFFIFNSSYVLASSQKEQCKIYLNKVKSSDDLMATEIFGLEMFENYGFHLKQTIAQGKKDWEYYKIDGHFVIGAIYSNEAAKKVKPGDEIITINGQEMKDFDSIAEIV